MKTLIIVDVQNDFIPGGSLEIANGDRLIPIINRLQEEFDLVVATQDWHPQDHLSFASNHSGEKPFEKVIIDEREETLWPDHCVQGTFGAAFHPDLQTNKIAAIFRKGMDPQVDSYSGFYDNHHQISTGLSGYLREKGVTEVHFCGLAADICVYFTIVDAISEGFSAVLIEDASQPLSAIDFDDIREKLMGLGAHIAYSDEILANQRDDISKGQ